VQRRRALFASLAAIAVLAAAACGGGGSGDGGDGGGGDEATEPVSAATWLDDFCTALGTWQTELTEGAPDFADVSDAESAKDTLVSYLDSVVAATDTLVSDIQAAGVPDVENGEAIASEMRTAIASVGDDFAAAKADVEALSVDDPAAFASGLTDVGTTLTNAGTTAGTTFDQLAEQYPSADLDAAAAEAASCQNVLG
jgi:hypothetical protein